MSKYLVCVHENYCSDDTQILTIAEGSWGDDSQVITAVFPVILAEIEADSPEEAIREVSLIYRVDDEILYAYEYISKFKKD